MNNNDKVQSDVFEIIEELKGIDGIMFNQIGITPSELENPTKDTLIKLREYLKRLDEKKENNHRL